MRLWKRKRGQRWLRYSMPAVVCCSLAAVRRGVLCCCHTVQLSTETAKNSTGRLDSYDTKLCFVALWHIVRYIVSTTSIIDFRFWCQRCWPVDEIHLHFDHYDDDDDHQTDNEELFRSTANFFFFSCLVSLSHHPPARCHICMTFCFANRAQRKDCE